MNINSIHNESHKPEFYTQIFVDVFMSIQIARLVVLNMNTIHEKKITSLQIPIAFDQFAWI